MATKKKPTPEGHTGTITAHRDRETQRQTDARAARAELVKETQAAQRATEKRLDNKPTDTRTIA